jgi:hypothetical protein
MFSPSEARKLAEAILEYLDFYGISEIDGVVDVLTGEVSAEDFIEEIESALKKS